MAETGRNIFISSKDRVFPSYPVQYIYIYIEYMQDTKLIKLKPFIHFIYMFRTSRPSSEC